MKENVNLREKVSFQLNKRFFVTCQSLQGFQGRPRAISNFTLATRMLLKYAYEFTPVQGPGFTGRKLTLVGPFMKLQSVHVNVVFRYFYIISLMQRQSCVGVAFSNLRPKEGLRTCVPNSNASLRHFLRCSSMVVSL